MHLVNEDTHATNVRKAHARERINKTYEKLNDSTDAGPGPGPALL